MCWAVSYNAIGTLLIVCAEAYAIGHTCEIASCLHLLLGATAVLSGIEWVHFKPSGEGSNMVNISDQFEVIAFSYANTKVI